jgi:hypothetical protein
MGLFGGDASLGAAILKLGADQSQLDQDMNKARSGALGVLKNMASVAGGIISADLIMRGVKAVIGFGKEAVLSAGDAMETMGKFEVSFGDAAGSAQKSLEEFASAVGRNKYELIEMAANQGAVYKSLGLGEKAAADYSTKLSQLAVDVGSFNNAKSEDVSNAFTKAMTGEFESLKTYGIVLNQTMLQEKLRSMGITENINKVDQATKAEAIYSLLLERTSDAQGDATRTSGSFANQMLALKSRLEEAKTTIGLQLLPVLTPMLGKFNEMASTVLPQVIAGFGNFASWLEIVITDGDLLNDYLLNMIPPWLKDEIYGLGTAASNLQLAFQQSWPMIQGHVKAFADWYQANVQPTVENSTNNIKDILNQLAIFWKNHGDEVIQILTVAFEIITVTIGGAMNLITGLVSAGMQAASGDMEGASLTMRNTWTTFMNSVLSITGTNMTEFNKVWAGNWEMAKIIVDQTMENIARTLVGFVVKFYLAGQNIINGLINGIESRLAALKSVIADAMRLVIRIVEITMNMQSPSKVMDQKGAYIMSGLENGVRKNTSRPVNAMRDSMNAILNTATNSITKKTDYNMIAQYPYQSPISLMDQVKIMNLLEA